MRGPGLRSAWLLAALLWPTAALGGQVNVVSVSGGINPAVADHIAKAIARSEQERVNALVIELDTPGGLLSSTKDIVSGILNARVPVIVFVSPRGAWAGSAGTFITLAGHVAAMAPGTSIGAAHPVSFLPSTPAPQPWEEEGEDEKDSGEKKPPPSPPRDIAGEKIENFAAAFIESIAEERERNVEWAVQAVRNSEAITQREALEKNVIDLVAEDLAELLVKIDGRELSVAGEPFTLETRGVTIVRIPMGLVNRFFDVISDPQIALLLILAGLLGLYVEFTQPGVILPGVAGVVCLILAGLALQIIPFNWLGLLLILTGVGLLIAEVFVTSFGALFASGIVCLAIGGYLIFDVPEQSDMQVPFWSVVVPAVTAIAIFGGVVVFGLSRSFARPQVAGAEGLIGSIAVAYSDLDPEGRVSLRGDLWSAVADENIAQGDKVRIVELRNLVVRVERASKSSEEPT